MKGSDKFWVHLAPTEGIRDAVVFGTNDEEQNGEGSRKVCSNQNNHYRRGRVLGI